MSGSGMLGRITLWHRLWHRTAGALRLARRIVPLALVGLAAPRPPGLWGTPQADAGRIVGLVLDSAAGLPVAGARIELSAGGRLVARALSGPDGAFRLEHLAGGSYLLSVARIGYQPRSDLSVTVAAGRTSEVHLLLAPRAVSLNPEVVTASRHQESVLDAPASVSVVPPEQLAVHPSLTPADQVTQLPGVDRASSGLVQHNVVTRGFNNAGSGQLKVLTDYRYAAVPSLRINAYNFLPLTDFDLDRLEVVRGPGAALYGPNTTAGVLHLITRSPFEAPGATWSVTGGERGLFQLAGRQAGLLGSRLGWKISAQYFRAQDFGFVDPEEQASRQAALRAGADPDTLRVGLRDSLIRRAAAEARVDVRAGARTTWIVVAGLNQAINNVDITGFGAAQVRGWRYQYAQVRLVQPDRFAQVFVNASDAGQTYQLRTGQRVTDRSRMVAGQFQQVWHLGSAERLTAGADLQRTDPRTEGSIYGRNEQHDLTDEAGAYLHSETRLAVADLIGALRLDYHSRVPGVVLSPRVAAVVRLGSEQAFRLTYNRAFSTPTSNDLFLDLLVDSLRDPLTGVAIPFAVRAMGVPKSGFSFRRTGCGTALGGLCMRSPFAPASRGGPTAYLEPDATQLWGAVVDSLKRRGVDLSGIPAPTPGQVASRLQRLDPGTRRFVPVAPGEVVDLPALGHRTTSTLELGYKGLLGDRLLAAVDLYYSWYRGFTNEYVATPNVFFEPASLQAYLAQFPLPVPAAQLAGLLASIPLGTISPEQAFDPTDILVTFRNYGSLRLWGLDAAARWQLGRWLSLDGSYSWVSDNLFTGIGGAADTIGLNAPQHKMSLTVTYDELPAGRSARLAARYVGGFPVISGIFRGRVQPYAVLDADLAVTSGRWRWLTVGLAGTNLVQLVQDALSGRWGFRSRHREFVRVPELGRVVRGWVRMEF